MGSCSGKPVTRSKKSQEKLDQQEQNQGNQQQNPKGSNPTTNGVLSTPKYHSDDDQEILNVENKKVFLEEEKQQVDKVPVSAEIHEKAFEGPQEVKTEKEIIPPFEESKVDHHNGHQDYEEEKVDAVKTKGTIFTLDQQSTQFTNALNDLNSKKEYQSSETSTTNLRAKKPIKVNNFDVGIVVQVFEPTQNSMEEAFSMNEIDEEGEEEESQENLTDENEENIAQKNSHFQRINNENNDFKIFNVISQRNPNDVRSALNMSSRLSHSGIRDEHDNE